MQIANDETEDCDADRNGGALAAPSGARQGDYDVGYGRPPARTRFRPGQSGNPNGRPAGRPNAKTTVARVINEQVSVRGVSRSISNVVSLSTQPTARECRDGLVRLARQGRRWLQQIDVCPGAVVLRQSAKIEELRATVALLCDQVDWVLPGTPTRYLGTKRPPPAFFSFVAEALAIARNVIESSSLPGHQQRAALSNLRVHSKDALIKFVEGMRGGSGITTRAPTASLNGIASDLGDVVRSADYPQSAFRLYKIRVRQIPIRSTIFVLE